MTESSAPGVEATAEAVAAFERAVAAWRSGGRGTGAASVAQVGSAAGAETVRGLTTGPIPHAAEVRTVVLVEGASDRAAVLAAAALLGRELASAGVAVVAMGGAMSVRRFAELLGPDGLRLALRGLCDAAELSFFERAGIPPRAVFVCRPDLEGELLRALGPARAEELLDREGDLRLFRVFQQQPAQRERPAPSQLHRFLGTTSGRKEHYARVLTAALAPAELPEPLRAAIASV